MRISKETLSAGAGMVWDSVQTVVDRIILLPVFQRRVRRELQWLRLQVLLR